ncbi:MULTISPECIES: VOC family protein [unclassified Gordonia (in: high G+C Gram-positive bacteria)]|uniref:VOC family protein n=1 Tax=unclassified Gordonia (in: high G+C Gram-positive bacteria) TaxID=2657482 RepID=UPI001F0E7C21|nr:VOC family protein [Gordonia sp. ABSL49_1]MCH5643736.1 VOC family protein [Gordonia sp. ABSL49_1]
MSAIDRKPTANALSVVVEDMAAALDFYRMCGLDIAEGAEAAPHAEAAIGGFRIMFDTHDVVRTLLPGWEPGHGGHKMALAFECDEPDGVDRMHAALIGAGHRSSLAPFDAVWGQRYAAVHDPDGNVVDFYCALGT